MKRPREFWSSLIHRKGGSEEVLVYKTSTERRVPTPGQFSYFVRLLKPKERLVFWASILILAVGIPAIGLRWYERATEVVPQQGGTYTEGLVGLPQYINPLLSSLSDVDADISKLLFSGIFRYNDQQQLTPDIITNYVQSEDQLTYTFFLRRDVKWHDGEPLDVDDVLFTIGAIQDPLYQSPLYSTLRGVKAEKLDEYSFSLTLPEPFAPFLSTLTFGILPEHLWYNVPPQNFRLTELNVKPVGSGPYQFDALTKDKLGNVKSFEIIRNEVFYTDKPYLEKIAFLFFIDHQSAVDALLEKKIEGLSFVPIDAQEDIRQQNPDLHFYTLRIPQYIAIFFNQKKSAPLKDRIVRQALARTVDRDRIIQEVFKGGAEAIYTPILPGHVGHNAEVDKYVFNMDESIRVLEEAGWKYPAPAEGQTPDTFVPREKDGVRLEFTISTVDLPEYQQTLTFLQQDWKKLGVQVNVDTYSPEDIQTKVIKSREYEALFFGEVVGTDPDPFPFWHSSQQEHPGFALAIFRDPVVDQLLEEARKTTNDEERRTRYLHFQNNIAEQVPAIFLYNPSYTYVVHKKVRGINDKQYITVPSDRFTRVMHWYVHTTREWKK